MLRNIVYLALAFAIPPVSVALARGFGWGLAMNVVLASAGVVIFLTLYAGPGLALYVAAIVHAALMAIRPARRRNAIA